MQSYKVQAQISQDTRARAIGMHQGSSLALKAKVVEQDEDQDHEEGSQLNPEEIMSAYQDYVALAARTFWKNPSQFKSGWNKKGDSSASKAGGPRARVCYNCGHLDHFIAECPYEKKKENGGKLVPKIRSKATHKKPFKKNPNKKPSRIVLLTQEEYSSGEEEDDEEETTTKEAANIAVTSSAPPSLFDSQIGRAHV